MALLMDPASALPQTPSNSPPWRSFRFRVSWTFLLLIGISYPVNAGAPSVKPEDSIWASPEKQVLLREITKHAAEIGQAVTIMPDGRVTMTDPPGPNPNPPEPDFWEQVYPLALITSSALLASLTTLLYGSRHRVMTFLSTRSNMQPKKDLTPATLSPLSTEPQGKHMERLNVFISYSTADLRFASDLAIDLEARGAEVFLAPAAINSGESFIEKINEALSECTAAILLWSASASKSRWVHTEANALQVRKHRGDDLVLHIVALDSTPLPLTMSDLQKIQSPQNLDPHAVAARIMPGRSSDREVQRHPLTPQGLDDFESLLLARHLLAAASDLVAGASAPVLTPYVRQGRRLLVRVNPGALGEDGLLQNLRQAVELLRIRTDKLAFYKKQQLGPASVAVDYESVIQELQRDIAKEHDSLRKLLSHLAEGLWELRSEPA